MTSPTESNRHRSEHYGALQRVVDALFAELDEEVEKDPLPYLLGDKPYPTVRRLDVIVAAEAADLPEDLMSVVNLIPPGNYTRQRLCDQMNSVISGRAWGQVYGTL